MKRYAIAYSVWLGFVLTMAAIAVAWYRHVEEIGWQELGEKLRRTKVDDASTDD